VAETVLTVPRARWPPLVSGIRVIAPGHMTTRPTSVANAHGMSTAATMRPVRREAVGDAPW
jgi:hypothetical protein